MDIQKCEDLPVFGVGVGILRSEVSGAAMVLKFFDDLVIEVGRTKKTLKLFMVVGC